MSVYYDPKESPKERLLRGLIFIVIGLLMALFIALTGSDAKGQEKTPSIHELQVGVDLPDLTISMFDGSSTSFKSLADFSGKRFLLIFGLPTVKAAGLQMARNLKLQFGGKFHVLLFSKR